MRSHTPQNRDGKVVAGIDGSPESIEALRWAGEYAFVANKELELVIAWVWYRGSGSYGSIFDTFNPESDAKNVVESALAQLRSEWPYLTVTGRTVEGNPSPVLVEASKSASTLVVGSRGHGEFAGMLLGSVSQYCATHAHCPVVVHRAR